MSAWQGGDTGQSAAVEAPRTPLEAKVMRLWEDLLSPPPRSIHDNFFELSGDSMKLVQFLVRARLEFGVEVPAHTLFQSALTVAETAAAIEEALSDAK